MTIWLAGEKPEGVSMLEHTYPEGVNSIPKSSMAVGALKWTRSHAYGKNTSYRSQ